MPTATAPVMPPVNAGILNDIETLWNAFNMKNSCRLRKFYEVAAEYELSNIYCGRLGITELLEFEERLLKAAFAYVRSKKETTAGLEFNRPLKERIFGVYATYVLYYAQPCDYVSKIFVTTSDIKEVMHLVKYFLLPERHFDTVACLHKLFADDAFSVVAFIKCYDPVCHRRHEAPQWDVDVIDEDEKYTPLEATKSILENPILVTMATVEKQMEASQKSIPGCQVATGPENSFLSHLNSIFTTLESKIERVKKGEVDDPVEDSSSDTNPAVSRTKERNRASIKDTAYKSSVSYSRHRRYADPNMLENFPNVTTDEEEIATNKGVRSKPTSKRKRKSVTRRSAAASHAPDFPAQDCVTEKSSPSRSRPDSKARRKNQKDLSQTTVEENVADVDVPSTSAPSRKRERAPTV
ncbi:hypothetical protein KIN20_024759, partial [Parelaphostrongylus tenuis]